MKKEKSSESKLSLLSNFIRSLTRFIWVIIAVIILAAAGKLLLMTDNKDKEETTKEQSTKPVLMKPEFPREKLDESLIQALLISRTKTDEFASERLDEWVDSLMVRVDNSFLDWYFGYFNQQIIGLKSLVQGALHYVFESQPTASEKLTEEFQEEFAIRVLRKQIAQMEIERITGDVVEFYVEELQKNVNEIPSRYNIPQGEWERYLDDVSFIISDTEGSRSVSLSFKTIFAGGVGGAALLTSKLIGPITAKLGIKTGTKFAGKAGAQIAAKTGAKVAAKMGGKMAGLYIGVGVIIWDLWDHHATKEENKPVLRQNIYDYLHEVKHSLLYDTESGIITAINDMERNIKIK